MWSCFLHGVTIPGLRGLESLSVHAITRCFLNSIMLYLSFSLAVRAHILAAIVCTTQSSLESYCVPHFLRCSVSNVNILMFLGDNIQTPKGQ